MRSKSIILLESNTALLKQLEEALTKSGAGKVVYAGADGEEGQRQISRLRPDLAVVGLFLEGTDGCGVIRAVRRDNPAIKIIATGVASDALTEQAIRAGADYYLVKPFLVESAMERIADLLTEKAYECMVLQYTGTKAEAELEERISRIFMAIGIRPHIRGYKYTREAIKAAVEDPTVLDKVTKRLYPRIAEKFGTTPSRVERAISHAIEVAWNAGRADAINAVFGTQVYLDGEKPKNSEFIALVADKLTLEIKKQMR